MNEYVSFPVVSNILVLPKFAKSCFKCELLENRGQIDDNRWFAVVLSSYVARSYHTKP